MTKLIILQGLPASGKSTYAKQFVQENTSYIRVCRDDLRRMRGVYWLPEQEELISSWEKETTRLALKSGYNVILDATNLNSKYWRSWQHLANDSGAEIEFKRFDVDLDECIRRDKEREDSVGEDVIKKMYKDYVKLVNNGVPELPKEDSLVFEKVIQDDKLLKAIIVDLDGTIALNLGKRSPYDFSRVYEDTPNTSVIKIIHRYREGSFGESNEIIFVSGREDSCRDKTIKWLEDKCGFLKPKLFMRKTGDRRKDAIVKKEILDKEIKNKYYIEAVFDDRLSVSKMWHQIGLTLLKVGDPEANF